MFVILMVQTKDFSPHSVTVDSALLFQLYILTILKYQCSHCINIIILDL